MRKNQTYINDMSLVSILWHVIRRHAIFLLIALNVLTLTLWLVRQDVAASIVK